MTNKIKINLNPDDFSKLFNYDESCLMSHYEVSERKKLKTEGYFNIQVIYLGGQQYMRKKDLARYKLSNDQIKRAINLTEKRAKTLVEFSKGCRSDFSSANWDRLILKFQEFDRIFGNLLRVIDVPVYASVDFEKRFYESLKKKGFSDEVFDILTHPTYETFHQRRTKDLLLLAMGKNDPEAFKKRWEWSRMGIFKYVPLDDGFIKSELEGIDDPKKDAALLDENFKSACEKFKESKNKLPDELAGMAEIFQKLLYIRDYRFEMLLRACFNCHSLLCEIAGRIGIDYNKIIYMTPEEIISKKVPENLKERMKVYGHVGDEVIVGRDFQKIYDIFNKKVDKIKVSGKGVSRGNVSGTAKIVMSEKEISKIEKGDIIVCDITNPDYLPALKKVSAIVANLGGLTSHSAIVAREFKIPCVVGTRNATQVFSDGDHIEVNADSGTVRKI